MTLGVLINTQSRKNRKRPNPLPRIFAGDERIVFEPMEGHHTLPGTMERLVNRGVDTIAISGGDGTVQGILTELAEAQPFKKQPRLALLSHGTTNMTAADVGLKLRDIRRLPEIIDADTNPNLVIRKRSTVRIENPGGTGPQHGMFFGSGGIYRAVVKTHQKILPLGFSGATANIFAFAGMLARSVFSSGQSDPERVFQPTPMKIVADGEVFAEGDQFALLVTTLDKLILNSKPFWNQSGEELHMTSIAYPVPRLFRSSLQVMYGRQRRQLDPEIFRSASARSIELTTASSFTLDGEYLKMPDEGPLRIGHGPEFDFICGTL